MPLTAMAAATAARLRGAELTYGEVGRTTGPLPAGYHHRVLPARDTAGQGRGTGRPDHPAPHHRPLPPGPGQLTTWLTVARPMRSSVSSVITGAAAASG